MVFETILEWGILANEIEETIIECMKSNFGGGMRTLYRTKEFDPTSPVHRPEYYDSLGGLPDDRKPSSSNTHRATHFLRRLPQ